jgi:dihydroorotate dehydrogenase (fumarate)
MADMKTTYMGLSLDNPIIASSSGLTGNIDSLKRLEDAGIGAVVLKSIFEEQISSEAKQDFMDMDSYMNNTDAYDFVVNKSEDHYIDSYLELVEKAKKSLSIPVIASLNGSGDGSWLEKYASLYIHSGVDAFELNHYVIAANAKVDGTEIENQYMAILEKAQKEISLPLSLKIGSSFSSLSNMIRKFDREKLNSVVLFNRFFNPDIDIEKIKMVNGNIYSDTASYAMAMRWTALMSAELEHTEICSAGGIYDGETVIKMLLAGAQAVQVCSVIMKEGYGAIGTMKETLNTWMDNHNFASISDFRGKLAQESMADPTKWERTQYINSLLRGRY